MGDFITVAKVGEIPEGRGKAFAVGDRRIGVFCDGGEYFALDDACPHMGAPLSLGDVRDGMIVCDRHLLGFRLSDGVCPDTPKLRAEAFELRVEGDQIQVRVTPREG